jgi:cell division transport system permease protein
MLGVISLSMIIYTIRLIVSLRQDEIRIMQLVGATAGFIRMPFLLEGLIAGLLGAIFGLGFLFGIYYLLILRFEGILFLPWPIMAGLGGGGILVGFIGSFISIQKYIEV